MPRKQPERKKIPDNQKPNLQKKNRKSMIGSNLKNRLLIFDTFQIY